MDCEHIGLSEVNQVILNKTLHISIKCLEKLRANYSPGRTCHLQSMKVIVHTENSSFFSQMIMLCGRLQLKFR